MNSLTLYGLTCLSLIGILLLTLQLPNRFLNKAAFGKQADSNAAGWLQYYASADSVFDSIILQDEAPEDDAHTPDNRGGDMDIEQWNSDSV